MPLIIKDYNWKETESSVTIQIPLNGVHQSKVDIFNSERYIKASFEAYFFEVILHHPIDIKRSNCTITSKQIVFELIKHERILWNSLEPTDLTKTERMELKQKYINEEFERFQNECKEKNSKKSELKRVAVREQMSIDAQQRKQIETIKEQEKVKALNDINQFSNKPTKLKKSKKNKTSTQPYKHILETEPLEETKPIPAVRQTKVLETEFTLREFPTPSRESRLPEEEEWLRNQAEARRSVGFASEDIRPEEKNPQFLKAKGDEFMKCDNYLGAISAYSFGIKLNEKFADLYTARAEAHLAVGNFMKTVQDCSKALELMKPEVSLNLKDRALCIGRRGIGLIKLGLLKEGIQELEASLNLSPNEQFQIELTNTTENLQK